VKAFYAAQKPIVAICIAPAVLAAALPNQGITLTIGEDSSTAKLIQQFGNIHQNCASDGMVLDTAHRIVSCSAYMRNDRISVIANGIEQAVRAGVALASESSSKAA
jgi:enhancing lycopene biosynthesis protein 2